MSQSAYSFVNQNWTIDTTTDLINNYSAVDMEITIFTNTDYDTYLTFLDNSSEALNLVDDTVDYLTSSMLNNFS